MYEILNIPQFIDERGSLSFLENAMLPFPIARCFWITGIPENMTRGEHAHRTCSELIVAASGSFRVDVSDGTRIETVVMSGSENALLIRPMTWCRLYDFTADALCLCLASEPYNAEGYINDFTLYREEIRKSELS